MGINVSRATSQASSISSFASDLQTIRNQLTQNLMTLNQAWVSPEMVQVNQCLSKLFTKLTITAAEMQSLASDITSTAYEIQREEEEAARRAAERAARERERREAERQALSNSSFR